MGDVYTPKISGDETHRIYSIWEIEVPPNNGPPLLKHSLEDDAFYVLKGIFSFSYANEEAKVSKGQFIYLQRGLFHTFKNVDNSFGKLLVIITLLTLKSFFKKSEYQLTTNHQLNIQHRYTFYD